MSDSVTAPLNGAGDLSCRSPNWGLELCIVTTALTKQAKRPSWAFLRGFYLRQMPPVCTWGCFDSMRAAAPVKASLSRYKRLIRRWDCRLHELGGDPSALVWTEFRPLRLKREEDWSDWLGWLFSTSTKGELARILLGGELSWPARSLRTPEVLREDPSEDQERRADILLLWQPRLGIHIEVKVGDKQFGKTLETGRKLQAKHDVREWRNYILIPDESLGAWDESAKSEASGKREVEVLSWKDVARGLRSCLWSKRESSVWRTWAWTFCGAVEQRLLGLACPNQQQTDFSQFNLAIRWMELLSLEKERRK